MVGHVAGKWSGKEMDPPRKIFDGLTIFSLTVGLSNPLFHALNQLI